MKINKITAILALFLLFGCDYQPIHSSKNIQKNYNFTINSIIFSGNNKINQELKNNLVNYINLESKKIKYDLVVSSTVNRKISSKDKKGNPERYIIAITFNIDFLKDKELVSNKIFKKSYEYKNMSSKYSLKIYEQDVKSNLVNNIYEEIIKYLNFIE